MIRPDTRYAKSAGGYVAYQVFGKGPRDIRSVPSWASRMSNRFIRTLGTFVLCAVACLPSHLLAAEVNLTPGPQARPGLFDELIRADAAFFKAVFDDCDIAEVAGFVTDDLEFFHDKGGLAFSSGADFVKGIEAKCQRQKEGTDFLSHREIVVESVRVYPINAYGAIQTGVHRFYAVEAGKPDRLTEVAQFTHVWKEVDGGWRLARVLSYDHQLAE